MGWGEGTIQLDAFSLHAGARIHTLPEGSPMPIYAQIVAWLDLQRLLAPKFVPIPKLLSIPSDGGLHELPTLQI